MLPSENSLTYFNDLIEHYRSVHQRLRNAPFKPNPRAVQAMPAERPGVAPEPDDPEPEPPDELAAAFAGLEDALTAAILTPHPCTRIINETCLEHGLSRDELLGPRTRAIVPIRQLAMWRCRQAGVSLPTIGRHFGGRDHTTVIHAVRKIEAQMAANER